jgi:DNA topoisomerase-1
MATNNSTVLTQLIHNGILIPPPPEPRGLVLQVRGQAVQLTPQQEEMALAWAKKQGTPYVQDPVFVRNFLRDFGLALGVESELALEEVGFGPAIRVVEAEREAKAGQSAEERKAGAAARKAQREELKEQFGYAIVNGERTELGTYMVEPSGIFMGRGEHPLRGSWKAGAQQSDITLNLSPDAPRPDGDWQEIVWQADGLWVARWKDKLSDKMKYIWLGDTAVIKQSREAVKFDKSTELQQQLELVRARIQEALSDADLKRRKIATACYLIDMLGLRVGDEKDPDEADTVGATTLRPEHVTLHPEGVAEFRFLGKDSVPWHKKLKLPEPVYRNLQELMQSARPSGSAARNNGRRGGAARDKPQIFPGISSQDVNAFLSEVLPGLTAKVFRTHHATHLVRGSLEEAGILPDSPEYEKWQAANLANVQAAVFCNHTKKATGNWEARQEKLADSQRKAREKAEKCRSELKELEKALRSLRQESRANVSAARTPAQREKKQASYQRKLPAAQRKVEKAQEKVDKAEQALGKLKAQARVTREKRDWNLTTSLKSYIDPRVFYRWGQHVGYDVLSKYYPTNLQRKFSWVREADQEDGQA